MMVVPQCESDLRFFIKRQKDEWPLRYSKLTPSSRCTHNQSSVQRFRGGRVGKKSGGDERNHFLLTVS